MARIEAGAGGRHIQKQLVADRAVHRWARGKKDLGEFRSSCAWTSSVEREQLVS